jgi:hypothetical protein
MTIIRSPNGPVRSFFGSAGGGVLFVRVRFAGVTGVVLVAMLSPSRPQALL